VEKNRLLSSIKGHDIKHECLRVAWASSKWGISPSDEKKSMTLASAGADGQVKIWKSSDAGKIWKCTSTLDHCLPPKEKVQNDELNNEDGEGKSEEEEKEKEVPQIYALQFIDSWKGLPSYLKRTDEERKNHLSCLMTSSDDQIHIWQQCTDDERASLQKDEDIPEKAGNVVKLMDIKFTHLEYGYGGTFVHLNLGNTENSDLLLKDSNLPSNIISSQTAFGGDRNPENLVFVFDAQQCPANDLLGVALSDGTLRLVNCRGVCVSILQLPGCESHLTAFSWDKSGGRLASCVASGHLILWNIQLADQGNGRVRPSCQAVLDGGHSPGRPLFGALFCGREDEVRFDS
jgi:WD40 repeat protein